MHYIYRSAIDGKIVSKEYAEANPHTTVRESVQHTTTDAPTQGAEPDTWCTCDGSAARVLHRFQGPATRPTAMYVCVLLNPGDVAREAIYFTGVDGRVNPFGVDTPRDLIEPMQ